MRTTITLSDDAFHVAKHWAQRENISLGDAVSALIRAGANAGSVPNFGSKEGRLVGRFALLPQRDEVITIDQVRQLMEQNGI